MAGSVFVIAPIGSEGSEERARANEVMDIISPIAHEVGLDVVRADLLEKPGRITTQIILAINEAQVVIADLIGHNPNVMYELGVADTLGKPAIIITDDPGSLPFDRSHERAFRLDSMHYKEVSAFSNTLRNALKSAIEEEEVDNPVTSAAGATVLSERAPSDPVAEQLVELGTRIDRLQSAIGRLYRAAEFRTSQVLSPNELVLSGEDVRLRRERLRNRASGIEDIQVNIPGLEDDSGRDPNLEFPRD